MSGAPVFEQRLETAEDIANAEGMIDQWLDRYQQLANSYGRYVHMDEKYGVYLQQTTEYIAMLSQWKREFTAYNEKRITRAQLQALLTPRLQTATTSTGAAADDRNQTKDLAHPQAKTAQQLVTDTAALAAPNVGTTLASYPNSASQGPKTHASSGARPPQQSHAKASSSSSTSKSVGSAAMPIVIGDSPQRPEPVSQLNSSAGQHPFGAQPNMPANKTDYSRMPAPPSSTSSNHFSQPASIAHAGYDVYHQSYANDARTQPPPQSGGVEQRPVSPVRLAPMTQFALLTPSQQPSPQQVPKQQQWTTDRYGNTRNEFRNFNRAPVDELASVRSRLGRQDLMLGALPVPEDPASNQADHGGRNSSLANPEPYMLNQLAAADPGLTMLIRGVNDTAEAYVEGKRLRDPKIQALSRRVLKAAEPDEDFGPRVFFDTECDEPDFVRSRWQDRPAEPYVDINALEDALDRCEKQKQRDDELQRALDSELETLRRRERGGYQEPLNPIPLESRREDFVAQPERYEPIVDKHKGVQNMFAILGHGDEPFGNKMNQLLASFQNTPNFSSDAADERQNVPMPTDNVEKSGAKQFATPPKVTLPSSRPRGGGAYNDPQHPTLRPDEVGKSKDGREREKNEQARVKNADSLISPTAFDDDIKDGKLVLTLPPTTDKTSDGFKHELSRTTPGAPDVRNSTGFSRESERQRIYAEFRSTLRKEFPGIGNARIEEAVLEAMSRMTADQLEEAEKAAFEAQCLKRTSQSLMSPKATADVGEAKLSSFDKKQPQRRDSQTSADRVGGRGAVKRSARSRSRERPAGDRLLRRSSRSPLSSAKNARSGARRSISRDTGLLSARKRRSPSQTSSNKKSRVAESAHSGDRRGGRRDSPPRDLKKDDRRGKTDVRGFAAGARSPVRSATVRDNFVKKASRRSVSPQAGRRRNGSPGVSSRDRSSSNRRPRSPPIQKARASVSTSDNNNAPPAIPLESFLGSFVEQPVVHRVLILRGPPGCGKSTIAHDIRETFLSCVPGAGTVDADCHIISSDEIAVAIRLLEHEMQVSARPTGSTLPIPPPPSADDIDAEMRRATTPERYMRLRPEVRYQNDLTSVFAARLNNNASNVRKRLVIVDAVNDKLEMFMPLFDIARQSAVPTLIGELSRDRNVLTENGFHPKRSSRDIRTILNNWQATPNIFPKVDVQTRLNQIVISPDANVRDSDRKNPASAGQDVSRRGSNNRLRESSPRFAGREFAPPQFQQQQQQREQEPHRQPYENLQFMVSGDDDGVPKLRQEFGSGMPTNAENQWIKGRWGTPPSRFAPVSETQPPYAANFPPTVNVEQTGSWKSPSDRPVMPFDDVRQQSSSGSDSALFSRNSLISRNAGPFHAQQRPVELGVTIVVDNDDADRDGPRTQQQTGLNAKTSSRQAGNTNNNSKAMAPPAYHQPPPQKAALTAKQASRYYNMASHPLNSNRGNTNVNTNDRNSRYSQKNQNNNNSTRPFNNGGNREDKGSKMLGGKPLNLKWNKKPVPLTDRFKK